MRTSALLSASLLCVVVVAVGCGGSSVGGDPNGHGGGAGQAGAGSGGAGRAGGGGAGGEAASACGAAVPPAGSVCTPRPAPNGTFGTVAECSWGSDPRPECRTYGVCENGRWSLSDRSTSCSAPPKPAACPALPAANGSACNDSALQCWYEEGTVCSCSACAGGAEYPICQTLAQPEWWCTKPKAGCPNPAPQAGSACSDATLDCGTSCELPIRCESGTWQYGRAQCPICAAPDTPIATPQGERAIAELRVGDLVYSVDQGAIVAVPIARVGSTPVFQHQVLRIVLTDGAVLEISPQHPLASGQPLSSLTTGDALDELHTVQSSELVPYEYSRTYDILPSSSTGTYFAAGAQLGSTLRDPRP